MSVSLEIESVCFEHDHGMLYIERDDESPWEFNRDAAREIRAFIDAFLDDQPENVVPIRSTPAQIEQELLAAALDHARAGESDQVIALVEAIEAVRRL